MSSLLRIKSALMPIGIAALLSASAVSVTAQAGGTIRGTVTAANTLRPLSGVQVSIPGTGRGSLTNNEGEFLIVNVPVGPQAVRAQMIGFRAAEQEVTIAEGEAITLDLQLSESAIALDEVVVTGTAGQARRREVGNALATVEVAETEPVQSVEALLQAAAPGIQNLQTTGQVGGSGRLQLRGVTSVSQGNDPLIFVDGVRLATGRVPPAAIHDGRGSAMSQNPMNEINPDDIARIEVIKGAAATTLYGTEASGGVIQIFTKRGTEGRPQWSVSISQGANFWPQLSSVIDAHPTDLDLEQAMETGWIQRYDLSVRGGSESLQYFISGSFSDEEGIVPTQWSKDGAVTGNFNMQFSPEFRAQFNTAYSLRNTRHVADSNNRHGYLLNVIRVGKGYFPDNRDQDWVLEQELMGETNNLVAGLSLEHDLGSVTNKVQFGLNQIEADNSGLLPFGYYLNPKGTIGVGTWRDRVLTADYTGTWQQNVTQNIRSTFSWGGQLYDEEVHQVAASGEDFAGPGQHTVSSAARRSSEEEQIREVNAGLFFQETIGWNDRLFLIGGLRVDGSSTFGEDYGFQLYPKVSTSYVISEEEFWPAEWWNSMRLRAAFGEAGKAPSAFDAARTWNPVSYQGQPAVTPENLGNPNLGPERTRELEVGFDGSLFDSRLSLEFTYYNARTYDALFPVLPTPTSGFSSAQVRNIGELRSQGIELSANAVVIDREPLNWRVGVNLTDNDDDVVDMGGAARFGLDYEQFVAEGYPPPSFFGRRVTNPNEFAEPVFDNDTFLGRTFPTTTIGLNTDVVLGNALSLSALGEFSMGGHIANATAFLNAVRGVWPACDEIQQREVQQGIEALTAAERAKCLRGVTGYDQWIETTDFFKLRDLTATYRLPQNLLPLGAGSATVSISGRNLLTVTDYTGIDPEVTWPGASGLELFRRVDYYTIPPRRSVTVKLNVTF